MPDNRYQPNDPRYYSVPDSYASLSAILGCDSPIDEQEQEAYAQSEANMRAYLKSRMPSRVDEARVTADFRRICPAHSAENLNREERRALTNRVQEAILDTALRHHSCQKGFNTEHREYYTLFRLQDGDEPTEENQQIRQTIESGDPDAIGKLFEQRINEANNYFTVNYENKDDSYLVDHFEDIHLCHDIITNAQNILSAADAKRINLSEKAIETLKHMQLMAPKMDVPMQRARLIANPMYEFVDYRQLDRTVFGEFYRMEDQLPDMDPVMNDYLTWYRVSRDWNCLVGEYYLWEKMAKDYPTDRDKLQIRFLNDDGKLQQLPFNEDPTKMVMGKAVVNSPVVVKDQNGNVSCYQYADGKIKTLPATRIRDQFLDNLKEDILGVVNMLDKANRGLFIGSQEYRNVRKDMKQLKELALGLTDPPGKEQMEALRNKLASTATACEAYLETKDINNLGTFRTARRYYAVQTALHLCQKSQQLYQLQDEAVQNELSSIMNYTNPRARHAGHQLSYPSYTPEDILEKLQNTYGGSAHLNLQGHRVDPRVPRSDVGNNADELRESINQMIRKVALEPGDFDANDARSIMSNMVVLEMVKAGRTAGEDNKIIAGPVERALANNPAQVIQSVRDNPLFRAMTENVSRDMLHHFLMTDGAKNMSQALTRQATQQVPGRELSPQELLEYARSQNQQQEPQPMQNGN